MTAPTDSTASPSTPTWKRVVTIVVPLLILALTLFATRATPGGGGTAIIAGGDGLQQVYRVGAEVQPGVTLAAVAFDHVELSRNGARELLYLDQSGPAPSAQSGRGCPGAARRRAAACR